MYSIILQDNPEQREKRQIGRTTLQVNVLNANDQPPSFIHPRCRGFQGLCADVDYSAIVKAGISPVGYSEMIKDNTLQYMLHKGKYFLAYWSTGS